MKKKGKGAQEENKETPKREVKIVYYDDGSTVADMSGTRKRGDLPPKRKSTFREKSQTFFSVMRKMLLPMLCTLAAFTIVYLVFVFINYLING